jgi:hypothetical protein
MKKIQLTIIAAALIMAVQAQAALWDFSYSGAGIIASGTLTTSDILTPNIGGLGVSGYEITGISGVRNTLAITGLNPNINFPADITVGGVIFDNGLITSPLGFNNNGLSFFVGSDEYNIFSQNSPTGGGYFEAPNGTTSYVPVTLNIAPVPEASTVVAGALMLLPFGVSTLRIMRKKIMA